MEHPLHKSRGESHAKNQHEIKETSKVTKVRKQLIARSFVDLFRFVVSEEDAQVLDITDWQVCVNNF